MCERIITESGLDTTTSEGGGASGLEGVVTTSTAQADDTTMTISTTPVTSSTTLSTSLAASTTPTAEPTQTPDRDEDKLTIGDKIGIALGVFAGFATAVGSYYAYKMYKDRHGR